MVIAISLSCRCFFAVYYWALSLTTIGVDNNDSSVNVINGTVGSAALKV